MKRFFVIAALVAALATTAVALASGGHKISEKVIGASSIATPYSINVTKPADIIVARAKVPAGASFGWHSHRGAAAVVVLSGTLTLYDSDDKTCSPQRFSPGEGFVEQPDHVHLARNEGRKPVVVVVTYLGVPHGANPDVPAASPGNCPF